MKHITMMDTKTMLQTVTIFALLSSVCAMKYWQEINSINSVKLTWRAGSNYIADKGRDNWKKLLGSRRDENVDDSQRYRPIAINGEIPESFDARQQWPQCTTIASVKDQANCGSCWAVSSAAAFSDRICISTRSKVNANMSAEYLMTCCSSCGDGCDGGYPKQAWEWFQTNGIVTGGDYQSNEGCQPYQIGSSSPDVTPACVSRVCTNSHYNVPFDKDFYNGRSSFYLTKDEKAIQTELMTNGPIVASFDVYSDFMYYKSGVYQHVTGDMEGRHAVRVIGWGVEKGVKYWLVANSWNTSWGEHGTFRIKRGTNECEFEEQMTAGLLTV